jgi:hypothetical protein
MAFTRFTSGRTGNLTFSLLNEIMDRIEALEQPSARVGLGGPVNQPPFLAKVGTLRSGSSNEWSFTEHAYPENHQLSGSVAVAGGRTSQREGDQWGYPLIGTGLTTGDVVVAVPVYDSLSKLVFHVVKEGAGNAQTMVGRIESFTAIVTDLRWRYTVQPIRIIDLQGVTQNAGSTVTAFNGAEYPGDTATVKGVGAMPPTTATYTRKPIRAQTIVTLVMDDNGRWVFSVPNGYQVVC